MKVHRWFSNKFAQITYNKCLFSISYRKFCLLEHSCRSNSWFQNLHRHLRMDWAAFPPPLLERAIKEFLSFWTNFAFIKRNTRDMKMSPIQESQFYLLALVAFVKFFGVHILKFKILQSTWISTTKNIKILDTLMKNWKLMFFVLFFSYDFKAFCASFLYWVDFIFTKLHNTMTSWWCHKWKHPCGCFLHHSFHYEN